MFLVQPGRKSLCFSVMKKTALFVPGSCYATVALSRDVHQHVHTQTLDSLQTQQQRSVCRTLNDPDVLAVEVGASAGTPVPRCSFRTGLTLEPSLK